jgi:hypothetical protein
MDIVHKPGSERPISKSRQRFRTLLAKVETLRAEIDREETDLNALLNFYATQIVPRLSRQTALQKDLVRSLAPYVNKSFFPNKEERLEFKDLMTDLLDQIVKADKGLTDAELRDIYAVVHGTAYAQDEKKTLAAVKDELEKLFAELGIEPDFAELESATSEADFMAKAEGLMARMLKLKQAEAEAARCAEHGRHSTEDEELRAADEARKRSVAVIYKQLARVLHPDLETDSERQKQKVGLMQELTQAYRQNDLHTLLRLEMQWIEHEGGDLERLTEEKLAVYTAVLEGQVQGLEARARDLIFHPRYRPVAVFSNGLTTPMNGPAKVSELDDSIAAIERCVVLLDSAQTADDVRIAAGPFRKHERRVSEQT